MAHCAFWSAAAEDCPFARIASFHHSCHPRNRSTRIPAVMNSSPHTPTTVTRPRARRRARFRLLSRGRSGSSSCGAVMGSILLESSYGLGFVGRAAIGARRCLGQNRRMARSKSVRTEPVKAVSGEAAPNPVWFKPVMLGFMLLGLLWIIVFYISGSVWPIESLGQWNILVGFGIMLIGFLMTTRWR